MKSPSISLQAAVRALMRGTGMSKDEAQRHLVQAIQEGRLPVYWEDSSSKKRGRVPVEALGPRLH